MSVCPCCGQPLPEHLPDLMTTLAVLPINGLRKAMVLALARRFGELVPTEVLVAEVWRGVRDGGPCTARASLSVMAYQTRAIIEPFGLTVRGQRSVGGYRLTWHQMPHTTAP